MGWRPVSSVETSEANKPALVFCLSTPINAYITFAVSFWLPSKAAKKNFSPIPRRALYRLPARLHGGDGGLGEASHKKPCLVLAAEIKQIEQTWEYPAFACADIVGVLHSISNPRHVFIARLPALGFGHGVRSADDRCCGFISHLCSPP